MDYETDEQQLEAIKKWWSENGKSVIAGVAIGAVGIFGWVGWGNYQVGQSQKASDGFAQTMSALDDGGETLAAAADDLREGHGGTLYATMGGLAAARGLVESGDLAGAAKELKWAVKNADNAEIEAIASIRLARVLGADGKADEGLSALPTNVPKGFGGLTEEVRGDLFLIKGDREKARQAYQKALDSGERVADNRILTIKLNDLSDGEKESS